MPSRFTATPAGKRPTFSVWTTQGGGPDRQAAPAPASIIETVPELRLETNANGAATAADAAVSESTSRLSRIPVNACIPENPLGSGHLVFMSP